MQLGQTFRKNATAILALAAIGLVSACADSAFAPQNDVVASHAPAGFSRSARIITFAAGKGTTTQKLGNHTITIPAGAICDPAVSTYGPTEWDKPCKVLDHKIAITATVLEDRDGNPYIDFQPALRFSPDKEVTLSLRSARNSDTQGEVIEYCNDAGICIDESLRDPSLVTTRVGHSSQLVRRVKHFSGYMISSGLVRAIELEILARRSGYMVASGLALRPNDNDQGRNADAYDVVAPVRFRFDH